MLRKQGAPLPGARHDDAPAKAGSSFGLPAATALVVGSIIGTAVFALPSALAPYGPIAIVTFVIGAIALVMAFGSLTKRVPGSGGPYVYARKAFGEFAGFIDAWS